MTNGSTIPAEERLLRPGEVAARFRVTPGTVTRYANQGKLKSFRTPGGQRRYRESDVNAYFEVPAEEAG